DRGRLVEQGSHQELMVRDGQYANLVRLQSKVSATMGDFASDADAAQDGEASSQNRRRDEDAFVYHARIPRSKLVTAPASSDPSSLDTVSTATRSFSPNWLYPADARLASGPRGTLEVTLAAGPRYRGVFAVNLFPATSAADYISLRIWTREGEEQEL